MKLLIIRHGQSANNALFIQTGGYAGRSSDPVLTDLGKRQAQLLADAVADGRLPVKPTVITSSLFSRAIQTAAPLADALDLPILGQLDTYEIGGPYHGLSSERRVFAGTPASELIKITARLQIPDGADDTGWYRLDHRESVAESYLRAQQVMSRVLTRWGRSDETVAIVCHQFFAQQLIRVSLGLGSVDTLDARERPRAGEEGFAPMPWFRLDNTATALIDYGDEVAQVPPTGTNVFWINRVDHLPPQMITI